MIQREREIGIRRREIKLQLGGVARALGVLALASTAAFDVAVAAGLPLSAR
jgi:hypothetical protein